MVILSTNGIPYPNIHWEILYVDPYTSLKGSVSHGTHTHLYPLGHCLWLAGWLEPAEAFCLLAIQIMISSYIYKVVRCVVTPTWPYYKRSPVYGLPTLASLASVLCGDHHTLNDLLTKPGQTAITAGP